MSTRSGRLRRGVVPLVAGLSLTLGACSGGSPDVDPAATSLPTPTQAAAESVGHRLDQRVHTLVAARVVGVDEDLQTGAQEQEVRLTWAAHGSVVDASSLPIGTTDRAGSEVYRSPTTLLERPAGGAESCWSPGGDAAARYDQPLLSEVAILRSARAGREQDGLLVGSLAARPLLGLLGSEAQLRARGLTTSRATRVPATFTLDADELQITTGWGSLAAAGGAKRAPGTWTLRYRVFDAAGPTAPTADMMCP